MIKWIGEMIVNLGSNEDAVVSLEIAISCMEEFFDTMKRPQCIEWQRL